MPVLLDVVVQKKPFLDFGSKSIKVNCGARHTV